MRKPWSAKETLSRSRPRSILGHLLIRESSVHSLCTRSQPNLSSTRALSRLGLSISVQRNLKLTPRSDFQGFSPSDLRKLYLAKCKDLGILNAKDQEQRFLNFCRRSFINRTLGLSENGLGVESIKVLSVLLKKNRNFSRISLSKNNIGEIGVILLANTLKNNKAIVSVNVSSNEISSYGLSKFFNLLRNNESLVCINVCSLDGINRNRLGCKGAEAVAEFLKVNKVLTHLNLADTGIGKEGLEYLTQGLAHNEVILSLDISHNGITCQSFDYFCDVLLSTNLQELSLFGNKIGNKGCEFIARTLASKLNDWCSLVKLNIGDCAITAAGIVKIFESLENNAILTHLLVDGNDLGKHSGSAIGKCFTHNSSLSFVSMNNCNFRDENIIKICDGLCRNKGVKKVNLNRNKITDLAAEHIASLIKENNTLVALDLSYNSLKNKGGVLIVKSLKFNSSLEFLNFTENNLKDEAGRILAEITKSQGNLRTINLKLNPVNLKYIKTIKDNLEKNNLNFRNLENPKIKTKIESLILSPNKIQEVSVKEQEVRKEKEEYYENLKKLELKLSLAKSEEKEKVSLIRQKHLEIKELSQSLSAEIDEINLESFKFKVLFKKNKDDIHLKTEIVGQEIQKLEKKKAARREECRLAREYFNNKIKALGEEKLTADMFHRSAIASLELMRKKLIEITLAIDHIRYPKAKVNKKSRLSYKKLSPSKYLKMN